MASVGLGILGAGALGTAATIYPKETLAATGLRTRSVEDVITGKKIRGSSSNRFLQLIGREKKEDAENKIKAAEKASAGKKGLVFVLKLLLKTLFEQQLELTYTTTAAADPNSEWGKHLRAELLNKVKGLKEREDRLLYIIAYSSFLKEPNATQDMRNLLKKIKTEFGLNRPDHEVTNWKNLYVRQPYLPDITRLGRSRHRFLVQLSDKIANVEEYIKIEKKIKKNADETRDRRGMRMVVRKAAGDRKMDPTVSPYERGGIKPSHPRQRGPFHNIGEFLPDTEDHKQKTIDERKRVATEKFTKEYHRRRRAAAIAKDIASGRTTQEEAVNFPEDYGRSLNAGGRRSRKRKTRKHRHKRKTRKRKTRKRKTQKSKTRKRKTRKYKKTTRHGRKRRTSKKQLGRGQGWSIPLGDSLQPLPLHLDHTLPVANIANILPVREYPSCNGNQCNTWPREGPRPTGPRRVKPKFKNAKKKTPAERKLWKEWQKNKEI